MLQITILWYAVITFLCGIAMNFDQLFVLRVLNGFSGAWTADGPR